MLIFMDTSALVKRYVEEQGSEQVDGYYVTGNRIALAPITEIEFHSAMKRKKKNETISAATYDDALLSWQKEKCQYDLVRFDSHLRECAIATLKDHQLRTLDAIQLASSVVVGCGEFVVADKRLHGAAENTLTCSVTLIH